MNDVLFAAFGAFVACTHVVGVGDVAAAHSATVNFGKVRCERKCCQFAFHPFLAMTFSKSISSRNRCTRTRGNRGEFSHPGMTFVVLHGPCLSKHSLLSR